jgi:ubiquinone/menaquinone biosynthesis C-methylase UbiE
MGLYRKFVLPQLIKLGMSSKEVARYRSQIIPTARGRVLEVGIGPGLNLPFYQPDQVTQVCGVDPSAELLKMAQKKINDVRFPVELLNQSAEQLSLATETIDTVVVTWTLCSIPDPPRALAEMRRVLKPDGDLIFVEHGLAPEAKVRARQERLNRPLRVFTGCNINRKVDSLIHSAGFALVELETHYLPGPKILTYTYRGRGRRLC